MRGFLFALAVTLFSTPALAQEILAGGGLVYGSDISRPGLQAHGYYAFGGSLPGLRLGGDIDVFLPKHEDVVNGTEKVTWWDVNANAAYVFYAPKDSPFNVYGLAGLNIALLGTSFEAAPGINTRPSSDHATRLGVNLGAGAEYMLPQFAVFAELKYVVSDADQLVVTAGLRFAFPTSAAEQQSQRKTSDEEKDKE